MRLFLILLLSFLNTICFSQTSSRVIKPPRWTKQRLKSHPNNFSYALENIVGRTAKPGDVVTFEIAQYTNPGKSRKRKAPQGIRPDERGQTSVQLAAYPVGVYEAITLLSPNSQGFFVFYGPTKKDSVCYFIRLTQAVKTGQSRDSVQIDIARPQPDLLEQGDSVLFTMKLLETPVMQITCAEKQSYLIMKFQHTTFVDNTVQRNIYLVSVPCPGDSATDYYIAGKSYIITAILMRESHKLKYNIVDPYHDMEAPRYWGLRVRKL
jgi:hypothetical protein